MLKRLSSSFILLAMASAVPAFADETNCSLQPSLCETVTMIDFNGNSATEEASKQFSDWQQTLKATNTASEGDVSYIVTGTNKDYNFQGVKGATGHLFKSGEYIEVTLKNTSANTVVISPRVSFDDVDSPVLGEAGVWSTLGTFTLLPNYSMSQRFFFSDVSAGRYNQFNINLNESASRSVGVDKITYTRISDQPETPYYCEFFGSSVCTTYQLIEFGGSLASMTKKAQIEGFSKPILRTDILEVGEFGNGVTAKSGTKSTYFNVGVRTQDGEPAHVFKEGEVLEFDVYNKSANSMTLMPYLSFKDDNNVAYGGEPQSDWYKLPQEVLGAGERQTIRVVITPEMAGAYTMVNFMPKNDISGMGIYEKNLLVMGIRYITAQKLRAKAVKL